MFLHTHPYPPFLFEGVEKLIVGTLPPPRFTIGNLKPNDVDFCYGSCDGQLWKILDALFNLGLDYENTPNAIEQRKKFLQSRKIGICDIIAQATREKLDASDLGMKEASLRNLFQYTQKYPEVHTLLFTGGNSKNGPEYFFRQLCKEFQVQLVLIDDSIPRIHQFKHPFTHRIIQTVSLTAPSGAANRAVGSLSAFKIAKKKNPNYNTLNFRIDQYRSFF